MGNYSSEEVKKAELVVLSGLISNPARFSEMESIDPRAFSVPEVRVALVAAAEYRRRNVRAGGLRYPPPEALLSVAEKMLSAPTKDKDKARRNRGILESLRRTFADVGVWPDPGEHEFLDRLDFVRAASTDVQIRRSMLDAVELLRKGADHARIAETMEVAASQARSTRSSIAEGDIRSEARSAIADYHAAKNAPTGIYIPTPWPRLNRVVGGGVYGRMWLAAAYAKQGKTQTAKDLVYHASIGQVYDKDSNPTGIPEGLYSLVITSEQNKKDVRNMILTRHTHKFLPMGADYKGFTSGRLIAEHEKAYEAAAADLETNKALGPIRYVQVPNRTTTREIASIVAKYSRERPIDVLMLDHTMLFAPAQRQYDRVSDLAAVLQEFKDLTINYNRGRGLWTIACHQIKREGYETALSRGYYEPSDAGGTAEAERSCDVMLWTFFDQALDERNEIKMGVAIDRYGEADKMGWLAAKCFYSSAILPLEEP